MTTSDKTRDVTLSDVALLCKRAPRGADWTAIVAQHYLLTHAEAHTLIAQARQRGLL